MDVLIPARGGSKELPRKNLLPVGGIPLVARAIQTGQEFGTVYVTTDDHEIAGIAHAARAEVLDRPPALAEDDATVDEVVAYHLENGDVSYPLLVIQPTVVGPARQDIDELIGGVADIDNSPHGWGTLAVHVHGHIEATPGIVLQRGNRQDLPKRIREIGIRYYHDDGPGPNMVARQGLHPSIFDIDTRHDLAAAEAMARRLDVGIVFLADDKHGTGHLHRALALADHMPHHDVTLYPIDPTDAALAVIGSRRFSPFGETIGASLMDHDVLITDMLDTPGPPPTPAPVRFHVAIEDLGPGHKQADLVVNALYGHNADTAQPWPTSRWPGNVVTGARWCILRPEFAAVEPRPFRETPEHVVVTFGGTDPAGLTERLWDFAKEGAEGVQWTIVHPPHLHPQGDPRRYHMAALLSDADLVICSAGRTVFEAAACGTPAIVIAQNPRETHHSHLGWDHGNVYLGWAQTTTDDQISTAIRSVLEDTETRRHLAQRATLLVDGKGPRRLVRRIEDMMEGL
jgi:spore coat polysaccharide biosynthesis predicted glycosyltransferase SpsG